jgi:hypothetical protein
MGGDAVYCPLGKVGTNAGQIPPPALIGSSGYTLYCFTPQNDSKEKPPDNIGRQCMRLISRNHKVIVPSTSTSLVRLVLHPDWLSEGISVENMDAAKAQEARQPAAARLRQENFFGGGGLGRCFSARSLAELQVKRTRRG